MIFRRTMPELNRNHLVPLFNEYPELRSYYNTQTKILTFPNGSTTEFMTADHQGRIAKAQGAEWQEIYIDEATHLVQEDIEWLRICLRWPAKLKSTGSPRMVLTCNPGGVGHAYVKRVFIDKFYLENERESDYGFIQAFAQDNVEWAREELNKDGLSARDYYSWTDEERMQYFVDRTAYGRSLNTLPAKLRDAHLFGRWDVFAGQYFDIFDPERHVISFKEAKLEPHHPKWLGFDWGFDHPSAITYLAHNGEKYIAYRELVKNNTPIRELGQMIVNTASANEEIISSCYLSPDAFARKQDEHTLNLELEAVFRENGFPPPERAVTSRIAGWAYLYELFATDQLQIVDSCKTLIDCLPKLIRDEDNTEDILKVDGDDTADSLRMGLMSRLRPAREKEVDQRIREKIVGYVGPSAELDPTYVARMSRSLEAKMGYGGSGGFRARVRQV